MSESLDPKLQALFADAKQDLPANAFIEQVLAEAEQHKRGRLLIWVCIGLLVAVIAWLMAVYLHNAVNLLTQGLAVSLVNLNNDLLTQILLPVNNVAGLLALGLIGLQLVYKKIMP